MILASFREGISVHLFKDSKGRPWELSIDYGTIRRVRGVLKIDLLKLVEDRMKPLADLMSDVIAFIDMLYVLCEPQAKAAGVTDEDFGCALGGDALGAATDAFMEELTGFFPPDQRKRLRAALETSRKVADRMADRGMKKLEALDIDQAADELEKVILNHTPPPALTP